MLNFTKPKNEFETQILKTAAMNAVQQSVQYAHLIENLEDVARSKDTTYRQRIDTDDCVCIISYVSSDKINHKFNYKVTNNEFMISDNFVMNLAAIDDAEEFQNYKEEKSKDSDCELVFDGLCKKL